MSEWTLKSTIGTQTRRDLAAVTGADDIRHCLSGQFARFKVARTFRNSIREPRNGVGVGDVVARDRRLRFLAPSIVGFRVWQVEAEEGLDAARCSVPRAVWDALKEAADRYSLTGLKKAVEALGSDHEGGRNVSGHIKRLIHDGDLDQVSAFLEEVKSKGVLT